MCLVQVKQSDLVGFNVFIQLMFTGQFTSTTTFMTVKGKKILKIKID
jgi:putative heme iron utilization protein